MVVIGVGLGGAPQLGVGHLGALVIDDPSKLEWKDAVLAFVRPSHHLAASPRSGKASLHKGKSDENVQNQHDYVVTGRPCSDARSELQLRLLPLPFIPSKYDSHIDRAQVLESRLNPQLQNAILIFYEKRLCRIGFIRHL